MAICTKYIRTDLSKNNGVPFPPGGKWTYVGYSTVEGGPYTDTPTNDITTYSPGEEIPLGDNFQLDTDGVDVGYYAFSYERDGTYTLVVSVLDKANCAGVDNTVQYSSTDVTSYDLSTLLVGTDCSSPAVGGTWEDLDGAGGAFVAPNLTPNGMTPGTYRFRYYLQDTDYAAYECNDCNIEAIVTVEVFSDFSVDIAVTSGTCTYTVDIQHPGTATSGDVQITVLNDDESVRLTYDKIVQSSCNTADLINTEVTKQNFVYITDIEADQPLLDTGTIESLTIQSTTLGNIVIPLSPTTAILTGVGGTINSNNLAYYSIQSALFEQTIKKAIFNYLGSQGYTHYVDYKLSYVSVISDVIKIGFGVKHNPTSEWLGIDRATATLNYVTAKGNAPTTAATTGYLASDLFVTEIYNEFPCPKDNQLKYATENIAPGSYLTLANLDYNNIPLSVATLSTTLTATSDVSVDCTGKTLTANPINCGGSVTYSWSSGETSAAITKKDGTGTYTVTASCTSPSSTATDSEAI